MLKKLLFSLLQAIIAVFTLLILWALPSLFTDDRKITFQPNQFIERFTFLIKELSVPESLTYTSFSTTRGVQELPLFPAVWDPYLYSFILLFGGFFLALFVSSILSYLYYLSSSLIKNIIHKIVFVLEAIPDVMIMFSLQIFFMWIVRTTGDSPVQIFTFNEKRAYLLPIVCLSILPALQMFRMMILYIEEEHKKQYIEVAYGKGFSAGYIMRVHLLKNIMIHLFNHLKTIFVFLLSNLFILEFIFHIDGIIKFLMTTYSSPTIPVVLIMILLPFYIIFQTISYFIKRWQKQIEGEII